METWLRCKVNPGMFSGEVGVEGEQYDHSHFSLFVPEGYVETDGSGNGLIRVEVIEKRGDLVLVRLPRPTFQNGPHITVGESQLSHGRRKQPA